MSLPTTCRPASEQIFVAGDKGFSRASSGLQDPLASWGTHLAIAKNLCCLIGVWGRTKYRTYTGDFDTYNPGSLMNIGNHHQHHQHCLNLWRCSLVNSKIGEFHRPVLRRKFFCGKGRGWNIFETWRVIGVRWLKNCMVHRTKGRVLGEWFERTILADFSHYASRRMIDAILEWRDTIGGVHNFHQHVYIVWKTE